MTTPDPTEYLLARFAEDEAVARSASIGSERWHLGEYDETVLWWPPSSPEEVAIVRAIWGDESAAQHDRWTGTTVELSGPRIAPHIARHDPARVLAGIAAKRAVVELHREDSCPLGSGDRTGNCETCMPRQWESNPLQRFAEDHPCPTLRALLLEFADREDFPDQWRTT